MDRRQTGLPKQWLITDERLGDDMLKLARRLPRGTGVLVRHHRLGKSDRARLLRRLRHIARSRGLTIVDERTAAVSRVHDAGEIRQASLRGSSVLFLSPLFETRTHAGWTPLPRMRAAALIRLAPAPLVALGGMSPTRFGKVRKLGFEGWAGIDAWLTLAR